MLLEYNTYTHDDVIKWKYFPRYWSFVPVTRSFGVSFICVWIKGWVNNREAGDTLDEFVSVNLIINWTMIPRTLWIFNEHLYSHSGKQSFNTWWIPLLTRTVLMRVLSLEKNAAPNRCIGADINPWSNHILLWIYKESLDIFLIIMSLETFHVV